MRIQGRLQKVKNFLDKGGRILGDSPAFLASLLPLTFFKIVGSGIIPDGFVFNIL